MRASSQSELAAELKAGLAASRERLLRVIVGVSEEQFKRRPASPEGEPAWSIAEVLAHMLSSERLIAARIELALSLDGSAVEPEPEEEREAAARAGRLSPVPQLVHGLLGSRREIERLLDAAVEPESLHNAVAHSQEGRLSIEQMVHDDVIAHEIEHVDQILALRAEVGAPELEMDGPRAS